MNIYDEVKVITHEEARKIVKSNHNKFYTEGTFTNDIQNYIAQCEAKEQRAKKEHELLGLYQQSIRLMVCVPQNETYHYVVRYTDDVKFNSLLNKIKALEEELK